MQGSEHQQEKISLKLHNVDLENCSYKIIGMDMVISDSKLVNYKLEFGKRVLNGKFFIDDKLLIKRQLSHKAGQEFRNELEVEKSLFYMNTSIVIYNSSGKFLQVQIKDSNQTNAVLKFAESSDFTLEN